MKKEKILRIESRSNPRVKSLIKKKELYLFEGQKLVSDLLKRNIAIETLIIHDKQKDILPGIPGVVKETWYVCENVLKKISRLKDNPAIIAVVELKKKNIDFRQAGVVIGLDNIQDPANAGTVFRCAAAFGIDAVAFSGASVRPTNPKFLRGAQDTFLDVDSQNFDSLAELIDSASAAGMNIYLTSSHQAGETVDPADIRLPCLIIFGNEGSGLPDDFLSKYPAIKIAQSGKVESLNAGISACIIMHELQKNMNK